jgi:hypothetical protein
MKTIVQKMIAVGTGLFLTTNAVVYGTTIYSDSTTDTGNSLNFVTGTTIGDEVVMAGAASSYALTSFSFEYYSPNSTFSGAVTMDVMLYANNGPLNSYGYFNTPVTSLFNSGSFTLKTPQQNGYGSYATLNFDLSGSPITVPKDFTLAIDVAGLAVGDTVGVELFSSPTVGSNYGDYWWDDGTGWRLNALAGTETGFGAIFAVPDPASTAMLLGAALSGLALLRRKLS